MTVDQLITDGEETWVIRRTEKRAVCIGAEGRPIQVHVDHGVVENNILAPDTHGVVISVEGIGSDGDDGVVELTSSQDAIELAAALLTAAVSLNQYLEEKEVTHA